LREGFTLVEVMLAVAIMGLLITGVYATWSAGLSGWKRGTSVADAFQRQRVVMEALEDLARSAMFYTSKPELYEVRSDVDYGLGDTVSFVTASDVLLPVREQGIVGLRRVTLGIRRDVRRREPYLGITNSAAIEDELLAPTPVWHVVSADVIGFRVRYRNPADGAWHDRWEDPGLVPVALEFTVAFRAEDSSAPPLIVTRAVEMPAAAFAAAERGQAMTGASTTNVVTRQSVDLVSGSQVFGHGATGR
jgi:prepilin-type N-terminal cleavage/methylation domain-containing protein